MLHEPEPTLTISVLIGGRESPKLGKFHFRAAATGGRRAQEEKSTVNLQSRKPQSRNPQSRNPQSRAPQNMIVGIAAQQFSEDELVTLVHRSGHRAVLIDTEQGELEPERRPGAVLLCGAQMDAFLSGVFAPPPRSAVPLSPRELEVLTTYVMGATVEDTAARHFLATSTVRTHYRRVTARYTSAGRPVTNKAQLLLQMVADGWIRLPGGEPQPDGAAEPGLRSESVGHSGVGAA